jgi:polyphosphate kinase 2 (PPK2 family)
LVESEHHQRVGVGEDAFVDRLLEPGLVDALKHGDRFLQLTPELEKAIIDSGIILFKYWLAVSIDEQQRRLKSRIDDGRTIWKLSPMDLRSFRHWYDYSRARDDKLETTDTE